MTSDAVGGVAGRTSGITRPRFELSPHHCFACGSLNEHGLQIDLHCEPGRAWTDLTLDRRFEGWDGIAHGGIVATLLDEVMAWSLIATDCWGVTARMTVDFKRPVPIGLPLRVEGHLARDRRRLYETAGVLVAAGTGEVLATSTGVYAAAPEDRKRELQARYGLGSPNADFEMPETVAATAVGPGSAAAPRDPA